MQKKTTLQYILFSIATFIVVFVSGFILAERTAFASLIINSWQGYRLTDGLVGYWSFDGADITSTTALDKSGNANTGTLSAQIPSIGKNGQSLTFNGTSDLVDLGAPASLNLSGVNKFTLSAWVYPTSAPQGVGVISEMYQTTQTSVQYEIGFGMNEAAGGSTYLKVGFFDGAWRLAADTVSATLNEWVFITGTWDGTTLSLYKNGRFLTSTTPGGSLPSGNYDKVVIGRRHDSAGSVNFFPGKIDETRIYNRALSAEEVQRLYLMGASLKTNVTHRDELTSGLVGNWTFDGKDMTPNVRDASGQGNHGGLQNQNPTTTTIGKIGQGLSFDGANDYVYSAISKASLGSIFSYSFWIKPTGAQTTTGILQFASTISSPTPWVLLQRTSATTIRWYLNGDYRITQNVSDDEWYHLALTYDGTTWRAYKNGVADGTYVGVIGSIDSNGMYFGNGYNGYFKGVIDEQRTYNRTLTADEVQRLYLMGASLKTNVSRRSELAAGLVGYWTFDGKDVDWSKNKAYDSSGAGRHGDFVSIATATAPVIGKIGQALYMDGTSDIVTIPSMTLGADHSMAAWVNLRSDSGGSYTNVILQNASPYHQMYITNSTRILTFYSDGTGSVSSGVSIPLGVWTHIAITVQGSAIKFYVNGNLVSSQTVAGSASATGVWLLGAFGTQTFNGYLDDARIYSYAISPEDVMRLYLMGK